MNSPKTGDAGGTHHHAADGPTMALRAPNCNAERRARVDRLLMRLLAKGVVVTKAVELDAPRAWCDHQMGGEA